MDDDGDRQSLATTNAKAKKPYQKPVLIRLGSLREMTRTVGFKGSADGKLLRTGRGGHHTGSARKT